MKQEETMTAYVARRFRNDPVGYCIGVLGFQPDPWQCDVLHSLVDNRRTAVRSGHGVGKTRLAAAAIHWFMATRGFPRIRCTANTEKQVMSVLWSELATINREAKNKEMFDPSRTSFRLKSDPDTHFAEAIAWSSEKSEAFAGIHAENVLYIFDEASAIDNVIWEVSQGAMTSQGARWLVQGNPTRNTGKFHDCFGINKWSEGNDTSLWHTFTVSSIDSPRVDKSYIEEVKREYGEQSDMYRVRVLGLPPMQESQQFISEELFNEALNRTVVTLPHEPKILGIDPARFGDDSTPFVERRGRQAKLLKVLHGQDTMQITGQAIDFINEAAKKKDPYDYICVDEIGIGSGVVDRLKEQQYKVIGVNVSTKPRDEKYKNLTSELWALMKEWMKEGNISEEFRDDMIGRQYGFDSSGKLVLERKEDMKKRGLGSPDNADALAITFYPLNPIKPTMMMQKKKPLTLIRRSGIR
jgi:hypothetical protein